MDFSVICPNDGPVEVGLENISTVILRGLESVIVILVCPRCGSEIHVAIQLPDMFVAAVELEPDGPFVIDEELSESSRLGRAGEWARPPAPVDQKRIDGYCEYFRRQLASASDVDDALAEIDSKPRKA